MLSKLCGINRRVQILVRLADKLDMQGEYMKADCIDKQLKKCIKITTAGLSGNDYKVYEAFKVEMNKNNIFNIATNEFNTSLIESLFQFVRNLKQHVEERDLLMRKYIQLPSKRKNRDIFKNRKENYQAIGIQAGRITSAIEDFRDNPNKDTWNKFKLLFGQISYNIDTMMTNEKIGKI